MLSQNSQLFRGGRVTLSLLTKANDYSPWYTKTLTTLVNLLVSHFNSRSGLSPKLRPHIHNASATDRRPAYCR